MTVRQRDIEAALRQQLSSGLRSSDQVIHTRSGGKRGGLLRISLTGSDSVVIKLWPVHGLKGRLKVLLRLSNGCQEWKLHRKIQQAGIPVPHPYCFWQTHIPGMGFCEVMAVEDLGETETGVAYLKRMFASSAWQAAEAFEDRVIEMTRTLLHAKIMDIDNQLNNFVYTSPDRVLRIDFECARHYLVSFRKRDYATMLDRLARSHLHAAYPEWERTKRFLRRLMTHLAVPSHLRQLAAQLTSQHLHAETEKTGIAYADVSLW